MAPAFVRWQGTALNHRGLFPGVFALTNGLSRQGELTPEEERFRRVNNDWYDARFADPATVDATVYDHAVNPGAVAWFKTGSPAYDELVARVPGYLAVLDAHGVAYEVRHSDDPGRVVYEDEDQVVVVPRRPAAPTMVQVIGPPAVGKMAVGHEIAVRTGLRLFHNHVVIEPVLRYFGYGTPEFGRLVAEFRRRLITEVAASDLPGMVFTYVCDFDAPHDQEALESYAQPFRERGGRVCLVELEASFEERERRNETEFRLAEKPSKRDLAASRRHLAEIETTLRLNSSDEFAGRADYLRVDNTHLTPAEVADLVIGRFGLPRVSPA